MTFLTFAVTLNTPKNCFHKTFCLVLMHHQRKFGSKRISSSKDIIQSYLDSMNHAALTLKIVTQFLCMTPQLMMYHHTKLSYKRFIIHNFERLLWVHYSSVLNICCDPEHRHPLFSLGILVYDGLP